MTRRIWRRTALSSPPRAGTPGCGDFVKIGDGIPSTDLTSADGAIAPAALLRQLSGVQPIPVQCGRRRQPAACFSQATPMQRQAQSFGSASTPRQAVDPNRFVSGITIDPANPNHAWISYSSYSSLTSATPGHVFDVTRSAPSTATWTSLDNPGETPFPDFPATGIARDSNGDLYVSNDWGVLFLANSAISWVPAGTGLPMVEVAGLTIVPSARVLYARYTRTQRLETEAAVKFRSKVSLGGIVKVYPAHFLSVMWRFSKRLIFARCFSLIAGIVWRRIKRAARFLGGTFEDYRDQRKSSLPRRNTMKLQR